MKNTTTLLLCSLLSTIPSGFDVLHSLLNLILSFSLYGASKFILIGGKVAKEIIDEYFAKQEITLKQWLKNKVKIKTNYDISSKQANPPDRK